MRKQKGDLYIVELNGLYVSGDYLRVGVIHLDNDIEKAHVFNKLKKAVYCARVIRGNVLFYGHRRTESHIYRGLYEFEDHEEDEQ